MPPPPHQKPENVLKRAHELIGVGQASAALTLLHEHITNKRSRNVPIMSLEPVMLLLVELSVEQKKGKLAKDALYQYKNISQNTNIGTIELVLKKFIELAVEKVTAAQKKADEVQESIDATAGTSNIDDLEATETPESILLATVSGEQSRDRTDRAIVTPWLKFLWEAYRTVLDILRNNARLEILYQSTATQAFDFCLKYTRKTEFRRLCELLRNHVQTAAKYSTQMHAINLSDPDTLQRHLDTRFMQLNVAVELELWQEAFKSVEDIHTLLSLSKKQPRNSMMANYFEKLTRIFLVSENYLFHAAAWSRYYNLLQVSARAVAAGSSTKKDNPTNITDADLSKAASFVLLSALSIPVISTTRSRGALIDVDAARNSKNVRLTNLLGMNSPPSRAILFKDLLNRDVLQRARPEIRNLYNILETDFHPKVICKKVSPILSQIGADEEMAKYVAPLQQVILTRLFQQLSQVYTDVKLDDVLALAQFPDPFQVSAATIEKFVMNGCKKGDLSIRIDHATGILTFDSDVFSSSKALHPGSGAGSAESDATSVQRLQSTPAEIVRSQLSRLSKALYVAVQYVDPSFNEDRQKARLAALQRAEAGAEKEHADLLARRDIIQKRKETAQNAQAAKQREEEQKRKIRQQELQAAETERLAQETREREERRIQAERKRVQRVEVEKQISELSAVKGVDISGLDIDELDTGRIRMLKLQALEREKNEMGEKLRVTAKRIDHLERAYRKEEIKHLPEDFAAQRERDQKAYEKEKEETLSTAEQKHKEDVALKHRLSRLVPAYERFKGDITEARHADFEKRRKAAERELNQKMDQRRRDVREQKAAEKRRLEEEERQRREDEEREAREAEEAERAAEEKRVQDAEAKAEAEKRRQERAEAARKQMEREEEAERNRRERRQGGGAAPPASSSRFGELRRPAAADAETASAGAPPRLALAGSGGKPSWREREAAKAAQPQGDATAPAPAPAPAPAAPRTEARAPAEEAAAAPLKRTGGYVPPALRGQQPAAGDSMPPRSESKDGTERWQPRPRPAAADGERSESPAASTGSAYRPPGARGTAGGSSGGAYRPPGRR